MIKDKIILLDILLYSNQIVGFLIWDLVEVECELFYGF